MNISKPNSFNVTSNGYKLNEILATMLYSDTVIRVLYLLIGVPLNSFAIYVATKRNLRFCNRLLPVVDLTACVFGSSSFIVLNTYQVNFDRGSLCKFILGSNTLLANLSGFCILNICIDRLCIFNAILHFLKTPGQRKLFSVAGMLLTTMFSIPFFRFYGETKIDFNFQNSTVSENICGVAETSENEAFFQVFPIVLSTIYNIEFLVLLVVQIYLSVSLNHLIKRHLYLSSKRIARNKEKTDTIDIYADKDFSVIDSDKLICNTCVELENETKCKTFDIIMNSVDQHMLHVDIETFNSKNKDLRNKIPNMSRFFHFQIVIVILFALSVFPRVILMIRESNEKNFWSGLSKIEYTLYTFFYRCFLLTSVLNPVVFSYPPMLIEGKRLFNKKMRKIYKFL